jgi:putative aminopeptidase FrvX
MKIDLLKNLYRINSKSGQEVEMSNFILNYLSQYEKRTKVELDIEYDKVGNILVTQGIADTYPCLLAHQDEVHYRSSDIQIVRKGDFLFGWSDMLRGSVGIGADDKNGIFIALMALEHLTHVKLLFTVEEEIGGRGARLVDQQAWLQNVRFIIQCDRRNGHDFITSISGTTIASKAFIKDAGTILGRYGYRKETGVFTDVLVLKENGLGVSCCNLSCGYYNPHTDRESTKISEVKNTLDAVVEVCATLIDTYKHKYDTPVRKYGYGTYGYGTNKNYKAPHNPCIGCMRISCTGCPHEHKYLGTSQNDTPNSKADWERLYD